jgi:hypothetical protein
VIACKTRWRAPLAKAVGDRGEVMAGEGVGPVTAFSNDFDPG